MQLCEGDCEDTTSRARNWWSGRIGGKWIDPNRQLGSYGYVWNACVNRRTKHIDVTYHYTRQAVDDGVIILKYCPIQALVADILTKCLERAERKEFVHGCGLREIITSCGQWPRVCFEMMVICPFCARTNQRRSLAARRRRRKIEEITLLLEKLRCLKCKQLSYNFRCKPHFYLHWRP